jgi:hypothetical protein
METLKIWMVVLVLASLRLVGLVPIPRLSIPIAQVCELIVPLLNSLVVCGDNRITTSPNPPSGVVSETW